MNRLFNIEQDELEILLAEGEEHLQTLDEGLVRLEREGNDAQLLQAIFRAAHTLKGNASIINHWRMADLTHALETLLDGLRKGALTVSPEMVDACLEALDVLKSLHGEIISQTPAPIDIAPLTTRLLGFTLLMSTPSQSHPAPEAPRAAGDGLLQSETLLSTVASAPADTRPSPVSPGLLISADIAPDSFAPAARALQVVLALQTLGEIRDLQPAQAIIESGAPVRRVTAELITTRPLAAIRKALTRIPEVIRLALGDELIEPGPPTPQTAALDSPPAIDPESLRLGEILVKGGYITQAQLDAALQAQITGQADMLGHALVQQGVLTQEALDHAIAQQTHQLRSALQAAQQSPAPQHTPEKTVRTSVERLDQLMNLVGELITDRNRLNQIHSDFENRANGNGHALVENLAQTVVHLGRITDQLQEEVMRIRMLPVATAFNKFPRLVRDLARQAGKQVELVMRGEDTELDRSVIEEIGDPLIHLLRNAVAHGLELPAERLAAGKPERGTIRLTARHEESRIIITIEDDGAGINLERVRVSALQKNLLTEAEAAALTYEETLDLIFRPGLSTASAVDGVSGRGVGMDIVRTNIERLNGNILIETWPGRGTRFQITLPLTLATISTLLVRATPHTFAIPLVTVQETLRLPTSALHTIQGKLVTQVRGRVLPLLRLTEALGLPAGETQAAQNYIVAVRWASLEMGLLVDALIGEQELVVKSLGPLIGDAPGVAGAAILGDGRVTLIVDVPGLFKLAGV
jgi:two-component system chemotaxis sensor kinase CheA